MAEVIRGSYKDIADAIRAKKGTSNEMTPAEMPTEIAGIPTPSGNLSITENGEGIDVAQYATVDVSVSGGDLPTENALYLLTEDGELIKTDMTACNCYWFDEAYLHRGEGEPTTLSSGSYYHIDSGCQAPSDLYADSYHLYYLGSSPESVDFPSTFEVGDADEGLCVFVDGGHSAPRMESLEDTSSYQAINLKGFDVNDSKTFEYDNKTFTVTRTE